MAPISGPGQHRRIFQRSDLRAKCTHCTSMCSTRASPAGKRIRRQAEKIVSGSRLGEKHTGGRVGVE